MLFINEFEIEVHISQKEPRGVGGKREGEGGGEKGCGLREGSSNRNAGMGGDPPKGSCGQTHIGGLSTEVALANQTNRK